MADKLVSIIINNYNYDRFVAEAIDSALSQTYPNVEVIVVDDGSTDTSRSIIDEYSNKILKVFKDNGGQASAFNAGFSVCTGEVIIFLDSDDFLFPNAVENIVMHFSSEEMAKVHWPLVVIDAAGIKTGNLKPVSKLREGDFRNHVLQNGPPFCFSPPTSGNAWSRSFLKSVLPMPEREFRIGADTYLFELAPFFGLIKKSEQPLGAYRIHERNNYNKKSFEQKLQLEVSLYDSLFPVLDDYCRRLGINANSRLWKRKSWFHQLSRAISKIESVTPANSTIVLVDDGTWDIGKSLRGRTILPITSVDGLYAGAPTDDGNAIQALEKTREMGSDFIVFAWGSFWWFEHYRKLQEYLDLSYKRVLRNELLIVYDLRY